MPTDRTPTTEAGALGETALSRVTYAAAGLAAAGVGGAAVSWTWGAGPEAWLGSLLAWAIQTGAFWPLWGRLRGGERALHVWVAGIGARLAGLGAAAALAGTAGLAVEPTAAAYGLTVVVLLLAEAYWLARSGVGEADDAAGGDRSAAETSNER